MHHQIRTGCNNQSALPFLTVCVCVQQQPHRAPLFRLFHVQVFGMVCLAMLLLLVAVYMKPSRHDGPRTPEGQWASYNADQMLSLLGMVRASLAPNISRNHACSRHPAVRVCMHAA